MNRMEVKHQLHFVNQALLGAEIFISYSPFSHPGWSIAFLNVAETSC